MRKIIIFLLSIIIISCGSSKKEIIIKQRQQQQIDKNYSEATNLEGWWKNADKVYMILKCYPELASDPTINPYKLALSMAKDPSLLKIYKESREFRYQPEEKSQNNKNNQLAEFELPVKKSTIKKREKRRIDCSICQGSGRVECRVCQGSGNGMTCYTCGGRGRNDGRKCYSCQGKGYNKCLSCQGSGRKKCIVCQGRGYFMR